MRPSSIDRLRVHVDTVVRASGAPPSERDDLAEELLGHLVERARSFVAAGVDEAQAIQRAIEDFGTAERLGHEFGRTYRSRMWASTVGVLLPAGQEQTTRPGIVRWLRFVVGLMAVVQAASGVAALVTFTPLAAVAVGISSLASVTAYAIAFRALARGQRWALRFAVGATAVVLLEGLRPVLAQTGVLHIPVGSILAGLLLFWAHDAWSDLREVYTATSRIGQPLKAALGAALIGPSLALTFGPMLPDPTQAAPSDVEMTVAMTCERRDVQWPDGPLIRDEPVVEIVADVLWRRADVLPLGLVAAFDEFGTTNATWVRINGQGDWDFDGGMQAWDWSPMGELPEASVPETGQSVPTWFSSSPSVFMPSDLPGPLYVGVDDSIPVGRTVRIRWRLYHKTDQPAWPTVEVGYAHLRRFVLVADVRCGEHATARPMDPARMEATLQ